MDCFQRKSSLHKRKNTQDDDDADDQESDLQTYLNNNYNSLYNDYYQQQLLQQQQQQQYQIFDDNYYYQNREDIKRIKLHYHADTSSSSNTSSSSSSSSSSSPRGTKILIITRDSNPFNMLSVELMVKIFNYCDPFATPLLYICRRWSDILQVNNHSLWRDLQIQISDARPYLFKPIASRILSYFQNGYGKSLHHFSLTETVYTNTQQQQQQLIQLLQQQRKSQIVFNTFNSNLNSRQIQQLQEQQQQLQQQQEQSNAEQDINGKLVNITKRIGDSLSQCFNLRSIDLSLPIDNEQLYSISRNCSNLVELGLNSILINDKGMEKSLLNLRNLSSLSISWTNHNEFIKQISKSNSTITPTTLYTISSCLSKSLKSLKFSLPPQFTQHKVLIESGIMDGLTGTTNSNDQEQDVDIDKAIYTLSKCKKLETLELNSCNIIDSTLEKLLSNFAYLKKLIIYRNNALTNSLSINSSSLQHLSISCLSMVQSIDISSISLEELYIEGCESCRNLELNTSKLQLLSLDGISGRIGFTSGANTIKTLTLTECKDMSQKRLEKLFDSMIMLEDLSIYLQQIQHLRICNERLKRLDIEAWNGIQSLVMDCPMLEELKANESSLESIYLKANHVVNIELDFCDSLRSLIIDLLSCRHFTFTQEHPVPSNNGDNLIFTPNSNNNNNNCIVADKVNQIEMKDIEQQQQQNDIDILNVYRTNNNINNQTNLNNQNNDNNQQSMEMNRNRNSLSRGREQGDYLQSTTFFLQAHQSLENCSILSGNMVGKLACQFIGTLSIEQKSFYSFDISMVKEISTLKTYSEGPRNSNNSGSSGSRSPRFFPICNNNINNNYNNNNNSNSNLIWAPLSPTTTTTTTTSTISPFLDNNVNFNYNNNNNMSPRNNYF